MQKILYDIQQCKLCEPHLSHGARPVLSVSSTSKIIIIGQAPGLRVHQTGIPWDDQSGSNLREWLGVDEAMFYNTSLFGIIPMGFCYPGKGKSGDLAPRKECAPLWHERLMQSMAHIELVLLVGKYAQDYYLNQATKKTLTERVRSFRDYLPHYFVLPHPSPRNNIWMARNKWFETDVLPQLKNTISKILS